MKLYLFMDMPLDRIKKKKKKEEKKMGYNILYRCSADGCGYSFTANIGFGFGFQSNYDNTIELARRGYLGEELMHFALKFPEGAIDTCNSIGKCEACGELVCVEDYSMYLPNDLKVRKLWCKELYNKKQKQFHALN